MLYIFYFRLLPNNFIKNEQIPSQDQHIEEATDDKQKTDDCKRTVESHSGKAQNGKQRLDDHDYTCMSPPKKTVNVTLDSDNKIKDSCTESVPTPKTTQCIVNSTENTAKATTSSASLPQILPSTSTILSGDTLDEYLGPYTTLDNYLDEDTLNFIFMRTTPTMMTRTETAEPTAGPTTDDSFYGRLMSTILEGIRTGHIKKQTLQNNENNEAVLQLTLKKK